MRRQLMFGSDLRGEVLCRGCYAGLFSGCEKGMSQLQQGLQQRGKVTCSLPTAQETTATWESDESAKLQIEV